MRSVVRPWPNLKNCCVTRQDVIDLIQGGEGQTLELKQSMHKKHAKTVVSFANAKGGKILLGVADDGTITGHVLNNEARSKIEGISKNCDPSVEISVSQIEMGSDPNVTVIEVPASLRKPHRCTEGYFVRRGASTEKLTTDELISLINESGRIAFDAISHNDYEWERDFDASAIGRFRRYLGASVDDVPDQQLLQSLGALTDANRATAAGILFFATRPSKSIRQATIDCVAFNTTDKTSIRDRQNLDGPLLTMMDEAVLFLKKHLNVARVVEGLVGRDVLEIPEGALREVMVNALIHRDYNIHGGHTMVEVFPDRVEISSPGALPPGMREEDLGHRSVIRNALLAELMLRTPYMEKLGTGISRILRLVSATGASKPSIRTSGFVTVTFQREYTPQATPQATPQVTPQVEKLLVALKGEMSASESMEVLELSDRKHFRSTYLQPALRQEVIEMTMPDKPNSPSQKYRLTALGRQLKVDIKK